MPKLQFCHPAFSATGGRLRIWTLKSLHKLEAVCLLPVSSCTQMVNINSSFIVRSFWLEIKWAHPHFRLNITDHNSVAGRPGPVAARSKAAHTRTSLAGLGFQSVKLLRVWSVTSLTLADYIYIYIYIRAWLPSQAPRGWLPNKTRTCLRGRSTSALLLG
jgi:hypothetical protein